MISVATLKKFEEAETLLTLNDMNAAQMILDSVWEHENEFGNADAIQFLGRLAQGYRRAGNVEKEVTVLEQLCTLAIEELEKMGLLASDDDIQATATDIAYLARAYRKMGNNTAAKTKIDEANTLLSEIRLEIDPDYERKHAYRIALRQKR